jgi:hypothetical protein
MKITATRTLMKSLPELWELVDDEPQLRHWSERLGRGDGPVEVMAREPQRFVIWRGDGVRAKIALEEKGFGTQVEISARSTLGLTESDLDQVLDELAEPQRRPFSAV